MTMPTFKISRQVGNSDFARVVRAEFATMSFVSYSVTYAVAIIRKYQKYPDSSPTAPCAQLMSDVSLHYIKDSSSGFSKARRIL
ncbi:hypothetical protein TNCV_5039661 [Trichonephila clavipes]|nr:hypothetical protein TNCV_5039661 [Trichonephila clavipes]